MQIIKSFFYFIFLFFVSNAIAQHKQLRAYNIENGLPQSQVYDIVQDNNGYLWLGTQGGGIARFDGKEFQVWNEKKGLISNYIHALKQVKNQLFIGTKYGLSIKYKSNFFNYKSPQINNFLAINDEIYLATNKGCYYYKDQTLKKLPLIYSIDNAIINEIKFSNNWFYFATGNGLYKVSLDFSKKIKLSDGNFRSIAIYKEKLFCATFSKGIFAFNNLDKKSLIHKTKRINNIQIINDNELWISTDNNGVIVINASNYKQIQHINKQNGLPVSHIRKCIKDHQSNIWLASSGGGIFKFFENNFFHFNKNNGLNGNRVYALLNLNKTLILSNSEEGLIQIDSLGIQEIEQGKEFLNLKVKTLANDSNDNLFVGTDGKGILVIHNSKKDSITSRLSNDNTIVLDTIQISHKFTDTITIKDGLTNNLIKKIKVRRNQIWAASYANGISKFSYNTFKKEVYNLKNFRAKQGIKDLYINDIAFDENNKLWYATRNGHLGYIYKNKVTHLGNLLKVNTSIKTLLFHKGQLFLATSGKGIWWSNLSKPYKFNKLVGKKELYSENIYQLIFDNKNQLWAGSENGVDKITINKNNHIESIVHFGRNDGFLGIETCQNAITKDVEGNIWFGTINGLTKYQPSTTKFTQKKPKIFFESIELMNQPLDSIKFKHFSDNQIFNLKSKQNLLAFYFKTVDINNPNDLQYRWKLDGYKWSDWNKDTKVNLTSEYGEHVFYAQARNLSWQKSDVIKFHFQREIPLLKKVWFRWLIISLFSLLLLLLIVRYYKKIKEKNLKEKTHLQLQNDLLTLEQKALRLQMNPHFIFNVLNGIKAMSLNNKKEMHTTINKFASLLRATLLNSRKDNITLAQEITTLKNYIEVEQLMSVKPFTYQLNLETTYDSEEILIPPMLIQPFVENAIRHGIMAVKRKGELDINFKTSETFLYCEITDNGIGINQSKKLKEKSNHQSMALEVTKERIEHLTNKNSLKITEIIDKNDNLAGTKVSFKIPLEMDY